jgi:hypothetical protein
MSISVTFNGSTYTIPSPGSSGGWADALNTFLRAVATRFSGVTLVATGDAASAPLRITTGAQPSGPNVVGALYMTTAGVLKVCTVAGTPGTWVSVGAQT